MIFRRGASPCRPWSPAGIVPAKTLPPVASLRRCWLTPKRNTGTTTGQAGIETSRWRHAFHFPGQAGIETSRRRHAFHSSGQAGIETCRRRCAFHLPGQAGIETSRRRPAFHLPGQAGIETSRWRHAFHSSGRAGIQSCRKGYAFLHFLSRIRKESESARTSRIIAAEPGDSRRMCLQGAATHYVGTQTGQADT